MNKNLLTITLIFSVFLAPLMMRAATATELAATISNFKGGGTGSLKATATGNTVTVTGTLTGVTVQPQLILDIDADITVLWQAAISGNIYCLIYLEGDGTFNVVTGGSISSTRYAIILYHCNLIVSGGSISGGDAAIYYQDVSTITIGGGTVSGEDAAISSPKIVDTFYDNPNVIVCGTGKVQANGNIVIDATGSVEVKENAQVISMANGYAIAAYGNYGTVTVSGSASVQGAISTIRDVDIKDNAQVNSTTIPTIFYYSWNSDTDLSGIIDPNGENSTVTISGTSKVQGKYGIWINGNVVVKDNAQIVSTGYYSIVAPTVNVSGGLVFGYGNAITGSFSDDCIIISNNFTDVTGTGTIIAWNQAAGNTTYTQGSSTDILQSPTSAKVQWNKNGESSGISYANGTNTGFIPLDVTVNSISVVPDETQTVGADGKGTIALNLSIPSDVTLTGSFEITFPAGMTLDEELTILSAGLSNSSFLSFTYEENNTWLLEIKQPPPKEVDLLEK